MPGGPLEEYSCRDFVPPRLKAAGWADEQIVEQYPITGGRTITGLMPLTIGSAGTRIV
jgi:hypothetical protein